MKRWIGVLLAGVFLAAGCGGGGGGGGGGGSTPPPPSGTTRVSGYVVDDPVAGATVRVLGASGASLATAVTNTDGFYEAEVPASALAGGFRVTASGGTVGGAPFVGELAATYGAADDPQATHATVLTTLVERLALRLGGSQSLVSRNLALAHLSEMGVLDAADWSSLQPEGADLEELRAAVGREGLAALLQSLTEDLADGDLSPERMPLFPRAHGGILRVRVGGANNAVTALAGGPWAEPVSPEAQGEGGAVFAYHLIAGPAWLTVDAQGTLTAAPPAGAAGQSFPYALRVEDAATGLGRVAEGVVQVAAPEVLAEGMVGTQGGRVSDPWGDVAVEIPAGSVSGPASVRILRARNAQGGVTLEVEVDRAADELSVFLPNPDTYEANALEGGGAVPRRAQREGSGAERAAALAPTVGGGRYPTVEWERGKRWFFSSVLGAIFGQRLPESRHREGVQVWDWRHPVQNRLRYDLDTAWQLLGAVPYGDPALETAEPVLFVHGYSVLGQATGVGGGTDTWGNLPRLLDELGYLPFELRWRTDARFQDAAEDLRRAVNRIAAATGRRVHLVTHSFGGLVARTYLQGLADSGLASYATPVASLTTLGTPHSGIFDRAATRDGVSFPGGQDSGLFEACRQLSCYQAGENVLTWPPATRRTFLLDPTPGEIPAALADLRSHPLPSGLPGQALLGLNLPSAHASDSGVLRGGDGLISFHGQRLLPHLRDAPLLTASGGTLPGFREVLLGADALTRADGAGPSFLPGVEIASIGTRTDTACFRDRQGQTLCVSRELPVYPPVYKHSGAILWQVGELQASVACTADTSCDHDGYRKIKEFLAAVPTPPLAGAWITLGAQIVDADTGLPVPGAAVQIQAERMSLLQHGETLTDAQGRVSLTVPFYAATRYRALVFAEGYRAEVFDTGLVTGLIPSASPTSFGRLALQPDELAYGSLGGVVTDAVTGARLAGAAYELRRVDSWGLSRAGITAADGSYREDGLLRGLYALHVSAAGYTPATEYAGVAAGQSNVAHASLRRALAEGQMSIVLEWGLDPRDLDSHLVKYGASGARQYHIAYYSKRDLATGDNLDLDDVSSFGPETTTIQRLDPTARYVFAVHHFAGAGSITATSDARVTVRLGSEPPFTVRAPTAGAGTWWKVFEIDRGQLAVCQTNCLFGEEGRALARQAAGSVPDWVADVVVDLPPK